MVDDELRAKLRSLAEKACRDAGLSLGWIELKPKRGGLLFRVFIDRLDGPVGLSECEEVTRSLGVLLDVEDPFDSSYTLEVSTPGLDRPLHGREDFERFQGKLVVIKTSEPVENRRHIVGRLLGLDKDHLLIELDKATRKRSSTAKKPSVEVQPELLRISMDSIESARLEIDPEELGHGAFEGGRHSTGGRA